MECGYFIILTSYNINTHYYDVCVFGPNGVVVYFK